MPLCLQAEYSDEEEDHSSISHYSVSLTAVSLSFGSSPVDPSCCYNPPSSSGSIQNRKLGQSSLQMKKTARQLPLSQQGSRSLHSLVTHSTIQPSAFDFNLEFFTKTEDFQTRSQLTQSCMALQQEIAGKNGTPNTDMLPISDGFPVLAVLSGPERAPQFNIDRKMSQQRRRMRRARLAEESLVMKDKE